MRTYWLAVLILLGGSVGLATSALADGSQPPLIPVDQIPVPGGPANAAPPQQVAALPPAAAQPNLVPGKIAIIPFEILGDVQNRNWIGRAVQQSLAAEIARLGGWFPISAAALNVPVDTSSAVQAAQTVGADYVVFGSVQFAGNQVELVGEVLSIKSDKAITGLKVAGDMTDLFALEDQLCTQLHNALQPGSAVANGPATQPANNQQQVFAGQLPPYNYTIPDYSNAYPPLDYEDDWADEAIYPYVYYGYGHQWHHRHNDGSNSAPNSSGTPTLPFGPGPAQYNPQPVYPTPSPGPGPIMPYTTAPPMAAPDPGRAMPMMPASPMGPGAVQGGNAR
jgi:TolB-like protein